MLETIVANLRGTVRRADLNGRPHLVAPATIIVPGVLAGNAGPIYYGEDEIGKDPAIWNHIPIVVDHPFNNGEPTSARTSKVLNNTGIGVVLGAKANGKLTVETWFDIENTRRINPAILSKLEAGQPIELSTGLGMDREDTQGSFTLNGKTVEFNSIARNFRPDHLAILTDKKGACSNDDGCGVLINQIAVENSRLIGFTGEADNHIHGVQIDEDGFGVTEFKDGHVHLIKDFRVQSADGHKHGLERTTLMDSGINNTHTKEATMDVAKKKTIVDNLVTNCPCWEEGDREVLNGFADDKLEALDKNVTVVNAGREAVKLAKTAVKSFKDGEREFTFNSKTGSWDGVGEVKPKAVEVVVNTDPTKTEPPKQLTEDEWMAAAPANIRSVVTNAMAVETKQKSDCIATVVANENFDYTQEQLETKELGELQILAKAAAPKQSSKPLYPAAFAGAAGAPITNVEEDHSDEDLDMVPPTINYEEEAKQRQAAIA